MPAAPRRLSSDGVTAVTTRTIFPRLKSSSTLYFAPSDGQADLYSHGTITQNLRRLFHPSVRLQQAAQPGELRYLTIFVLGPGVDHSPVQAGVRTLPVIVFEELPDHISQLGLAGQNQAVKALGLYRLDERLNMPVVSGGVSFAPGSSSAWVRPPPSVMLPATAFLSSPGSTIPPEVGQWLIPSSLMPLFNFRVPLYSL